MILDTKIEIPNRIKKYCILLLSLSITSIMLLSIIPLVTVVGYNTNGQSVSLSMASMKAIQNKDMYDVLEKIENTNNLIWLVIFLSLSSLTGIVINFYKYNKHVYYSSKILVFFGLPVLFVNSAIFLMIYNFIIKVLELDSISLAYFANPPFKYPYIILILVFVMLILSIFYFFNLIRFLISDIKGHKK